MKNKIVLASIATALILLSCTGKTDTNVLKLAGTWQLITGTVIENGDTTVTDYTKNISFIKIINDTHFAFLQHDVNKGKDSVAVFASGVELIYLKIVCTPNI
jgi:PBP1b-binding outer membrane lipoprotein LpoB